MGRSFRCFFGVFLLGTASLHFFKAVGYHLLDEGRWMLGVFGVMFAALWFGYKDKSTP